MENNTSPAPVHQLVRRALEVCQGYEYYYDAYYGPDAPFADGRPKPADVAMALQNICRLVPEVIRGLRREREELLAIADRNREELAARVRYLEGELAMPVGPNRFAVRRLAQQTLFQVEQSNAKAQPADQETSHGK